VISPEAEFVVAVVSAYVSGARAEEVAGLAARNLAKNDSSVGQISRDKVGRAQLQASGKSRDFIRIERNMRLVAR